LRSEKTEFNHIEEIIKRLALCRFDLRIQLQHNQRKALVLAAAQTDLAQEQRLVKLCGQAFVAQAIKIEVSINDIHLSGWLSLPAYTLPQPTLQYLYVNGRIVRDKIVTHAIRQAYADLIPSGRQPAFVLFLQLDPSLVDVNVHPTKHEVRFREARLVHDFVVRAIKQCLQKEESELNHFTPAEIVHSGIEKYQEYPANKRSFSNTQIKEQMADYAPFIQQANADTIVASELPSKQGEKYSSLLGTAVALVLDQFIIAKRSDSLVLINVEAAKRQIVIQELSQQLQQQNSITQPLLFPETLTFSKAKSSFLLYVKILTKLGFEIESFGPELWLLRKAPRILGVLPWQEAFDIVVNSLREDEKCEESLAEKIIYAVADFMAKHYKIVNELATLNQFLQEVEKYLGTMRQLKDAPWREFSKKELSELLS
jgi:DNA mismatch repair protein MutL